MRGGDEVSGPNDATVLRPDTGDEHLSCAGFTLLEVMVALAIVAALLVSLLYTTAYHLDVAGRHEALTVATMLARDKIGAIRRDPKHELENMEGEFDEPYEDYSFTIEHEQTMIFSVSVSKISVTVAGRGEQVTLRKVLQSSKVGK